MSIEGIRTFISQNMCETYNWYADQIGCAKDTLTRFVEGGRNARLDTVEMFLNEMGCELTVKPIVGTRDYETAYREGYNKGKADLLNGLTGFIDDMRGDNE